MDPHLDRVWRSLSAGQKQFFALEYGQKVRELYLAEHGTYPDETEEEVNEHWMLLDLRQLSFLHQFADCYPGRSPSVNWLPCDKHQQDVCWQEEGSYSTLYRPRWRPKSNNIHMAGGVALSNVDVSVTPKAGVLADPGVLSPAISPSATSHSPLTVIQLSPPDDADDDCRVTPPGGLPVMLLGMDMDELPVDINEVGDVGEINLRGDRDIIEAKTVDD
jgi:hypothetical protein